jgi:hypothetical protein
MAVKKITVLPNQSIWDISVQYFGSVDGVKQLILDNPNSCDFENSLVPGTLLVIQDAPINKAVVEYFDNRIIKPATAIESPIISGWILDTGIWNDNKWWNDNQWWID